MKVNIKMPGTPEKAARGLIRATIIDRRKKGETGGTDGAECAACQALLAPGWRSDDPEAWGLIHELSTFERLWRDEMRKLGFKVLPIPKPTIQKPTDDDDIG